MKSIFLLCFLSFSLFVFAHEGHHHHEKKVFSSEKIQAQIGETAHAGRPTSWLQWFGGFHFALLHFPIALLNMVAIAEFLWVRYEKHIFEFASRFMLVAAAIFSLPTALLGFIYSYSAEYSGVMGTYLLWHMWLGIATAILAVATAFIREYRGAVNLYYGSLILLVLIVNFAAILGGWMTFGPNHMSLPPVHFQYD